MTLKYPRLFLLPLFIVLITGATYLAYALTPDDGDVAILAGEVPLVDPTSPEPATAVAFFKKRVAERPESTVDLVLLAQAYGRRARALHDPDDYTLAEAAIQRALQLRPDDPSARRHQAALHIVNHRFAEALEWARPLLGTGEGVAALALVGDAEMALGNYAAAEAAYEELATYSPAASTFSRLAALAYVHGDPDEALRLAQQAAETARSAADYRENVAWHYYQLGHFAFETGDYRRADEAFAMAREALPGYRLAQAGLGDVAAAEGRLEEAIGYYEAATATPTDPDFHMRLGELYLLAGRPEAAGRQFEMVIRLARSDVGLGSPYAHDLARFYADHEREVATAVTLAEQELTWRRDIGSYDLAAWANLKAGNVDRAARLMAQALSQGTRDATLFYHAALIALAQGDRLSARTHLTAALQLNPAFHPRHAAHAAALLRDLEGLP